MMRVTAALIGAYVAMIIGSLIRNCTKCVRDDLQYSKCSPLTIVRAKSPTLENDSRNNEPQSCWMNETTKWMKSTAIVSQLKEPIYKRFLDNNTH